MSEVLRRLPESRFSEILPAWQGQTVVLLGGGASLTQDQFEMVEEAHESDRVRVIAINDSYLCAPWADVLYAADAEWHVWHSKGIPKPALRLSADEVRSRFAAFAGPKCSIENQAPNITDDAVHILRNADKRGGGVLSADRGALVTGRNSGFQALNFAILAGAKTVILLGFDAREPYGPNWRSHWHGDHPRIEAVQVYAEYRRAFSAAERAIKEAGVSVVNCSPDTMINSFPRVPLDLALQPMVAYG